MKSFKETFEDPFERVSNAERREQGESDYKMPLTIPQRRYYVIFFPRGNTFLGCGSIWANLDRADRWSTEEVAREAFMLLPPDLYRVKKNLYRVKKKDIRIQSYPLGSSNPADILSDEPV
jgi:hypothetical protein